MPTRSSARHRSPPFLPETTTQLTSSVRDLIAENSELELTDAISNDDDLFAAGMQSLDCVRILVAVEDEFEIELPNDRIDRSIFLHCHQPHGRGR